MDGPSWTCLGEGAAHPADLELIEWTREKGNTRIAIRRCRTCGQLYRWLQFELNDWSGGGDYCDETTIWTMIDEGEVDLIRGNPNYEPRSGREHRYDTGWR